MLSDTWLLGNLGRSIATFVFSAQIYTCVQAGMLARGKRKDTGWESHCVKNLNLNRWPIGWSADHASYKTILLPQCTCTHANTPSHWQYQRFLTPHCYVQRGHYNLQMENRWITDTCHLIPLSGRCTNRCTSGQEKNIHHIAWKTISLCASWSTLYHSNSGQGNREMMREKRT